MAWVNVASATPKKYSCGYCHSLVASKSAYFTDKAPQHWIYICPNCEGPSIFILDKQVPGVVGAEVLLTICRRKWLDLGVAFRPNRLPLRS